MYDKKKKYVYYTISNLHRFCKTIKYLVIYHSYGIVISKVNGYRFVNYVLKYIQYRDILILHALNSVSVIFKEYNILCIVVLILIDLDNTLYVLYYNKRMCIIISGPI